MKIIVTAIALCFIVSVADARCMSRVVSSNDESAAHAEFIFTCHDGMKGRTTVYDDSVVFSFGLVPVDESPQYHFRRVGITTFPMKNDLAGIGDVDEVDLMTPPVKDESECGLTEYQHIISSLIPPELRRETRVLFTTKGYTEHRNEDDRCNDKQEATGLFVGSYHPGMTSRKIVANVFNSLIVMHLNHLHGEGVFIEWKEDPDILILPDGNFAFPPPIGFPPPWIIDKTGP